MITQEEELLAEQMLRLLTDQKLHKKYADAALKRAACFSNEAYVEQLHWDGGGCVKGKIQL